MIDKLRQIRKKSLKEIPDLSERELSNPVSYWIKEDRLLNEIGKEFTIILRTKGCRWALSEQGGCSMCGYIKDSYITNIKPQYIKNQFLIAWNAKIEEIEKSDVNFIIKIFNSGSFFDDEEITEETRHIIYEKISQVDKIKEVVVESRVEFLDENKLKKMKEMLGDKHIEIAIGLETSNDWIRINYLNKGLLYQDFLMAVKLCRSCQLGIRVYLLFKPPFLNESSAVDDCVTSIKKMIELNIDTISINPVNIQKGTLVEYLWKKELYRPPWFYSLIKCLNSAIKSQDVLNNTRIVSDPSGAGTIRGIHNCNDKFCNGRMKEILQDFVLAQEISRINNLEEQIECNCKLKYHIQKIYE
jgi:radical SAM enzyme (TIGR01210 family)